MSFPSVGSFESSAASSLCDKTIAILPPHVNRALAAQGLETDVHGVVRWAEVNTTHPRNRPLLRKVFDSTLICFLEFFTTIISNTGPSIAPMAAKDLGISRELSVFSFITVFLFGQGIGGLILPPISESFGCRTIYLTATFCFAVSSFIIAVCPLLPIVVTFQFVMGFTTAMPSVVAAGNLENMWDMKSRTFAIHAWTAVAVLALGIGPVMATHISTSSLGWRWVFYISGIVTGFLTLLFLGLRESRPSEVLRHLVNRITRETAFTGLSINTNNTRPTLKTFARTSLLLPLRLFFTEPIVYLTSVLSATVYGVIYLFSEAISVVYHDGFGLSTRIASLPNLAITLGAVFTVLPRFHDIKTMERCRRQGIPFEPEHKLFGFYVAAPVLAIGLWWFSCTVPPLVTNVSPWASIVALVLVGYTAVEFDNVLSGYLCDSYTAYTASALAPMAFLRAVLSGVFPLFGRPFFAGLGSNNASFILAAIATTFCGVAVLFSIYGKRIRQRSQFAWKGHSAPEEAVDVEKVNIGDVSLTIEQALLCS